MLSIKSCNSNSPTPLVIKEGQIWRGKISKKFYFVIRIPDGNLCLISILTCNYLYSYTDLENFDEDLFMERFSLFTGTIELETDDA